MMAKLTVHIIIIIISATLCFSQKQHNLRLNIVDQNGDRVESAIVVVRSKVGAELFRKNVNEGKTSLSLPVGKRLIIEISAKGFEPFTKEIFSGNSLGVLTAKLSVKALEEEVTIQQTEREKRFSNATTKIFSEEEIAKLPESPDEIKRELKRRYGDNVIMRIDGFTGGQFPTRSQISSISIVFSPIDAEFQEVGTTLIDIRTKVIHNKNWNGSVNFSLFDSALNARNAFAAEKPPEKMQNLFFYLSPPTIGKNTALGFSLSASNHTRREILLAKNIDNTNFGRDLSEYRIAPELSLKQNLTDSHTLYAKYSLYWSRAFRTGLGTLDFSDRAYSSSFTSNDARISENGRFGGIYSNQLKFRWVESETEISPLSNMPTIFVAGEFNTGGAGIRSKAKDTDVDLSDIVSFSKNGHYIKFGAGIKRNSVDFLVGDNLNGSFTFSSLSNFQDGKPLLFEIRRDAARFNYTDTRISGFIQDYFNLGKFFQLGLGLRWDYQSRFRDSNNFSPRISFTWSPEKTGKVIVRGGYGRIYFTLDSDFFSGILANGKDQPKIQRIFAPGFPDPFGSGSEIGNTTISRLGDLRNPETDTLVIAGIFEPWKSFKLSTGYVFGRGTHFPRIRDINPPVDGIRPNPKFGIIRLNEFAGNLTSRLFTVNSNFRFRRFGFRASYTFMRTEADFAPDELPTNNDNLKLDRGPMNDDRRHNIKFSTFFSLFDVFNYVPFSDINIGLDSSILSGLPYNLTTGIDENEDGIINDRPLGITRNSERGDWNYRTDLNVRWSPKWLRSNHGIKRLSFSTSIFNLFNHTNRTNFIGVQTSKFFGRATSALPGRSVRVRANYTF